MHTISKQTWVYRYTQINIVYIIWFEHAREACLSASLEKCILWGYQYLLHWYILQQYLTDIILYYYYDVLIYMLLIIYNYYNSKVMDSYTTGSEKYYTLKCIYRDTHIAQIYNTIVYNLIGACKRSMFVC